MCHERWALDVVIKRKVFTLTSVYNDLNCVYVHTLSLSLALTDGFVLVCGKHSFVI